MPICLVISCRLLLSHMIRLHKLNIFVCISLFRVPRPFIILYALPPSPNISSPFLHLVARKLVHKAFNEVAMNFLWRYALLTEILYECYNFSFVHFISLTPPSRLQRISIEINSFEILFFLPKMLNKIILSTDRGFNLFILSKSGWELDISSLIFWKAKDGNYRVVSFFSWFIYLSNQYDCY